MYSNSRFFHRAKGGRLEAAFVALFTLVFFFISFRVLPYVPTIQASALVLFVGIELMVEALWESTASLTCCEWTVVVSTTVACTLLGFAPGVGVGLAVVVVLQFCYHILDTVACHVSSEEHTLIYRTATSSHATMHTRTVEFFRASPAAQTRH